MGHTERRTVRNTLPILSRRRSNRGANRVLRRARFDAHAQQQETAGREAKPKPRHGFRGNEEASLCAPAGCTSSGALAGHRVCMRGLAEGRDHLHPAPPPKACVAYSIARDAVAPRLLSNLETIQEAPSGAE